MPVVKPIAGHTSVRGVSEYLQRKGRALAVDLYNLSWDEDRDADLDPALKKDVDWAEEMDLTRVANGNDTPWRGKRARTYMHFVLSPDPTDEVTLAQLRELTRAWIRENWDDYECAAVFHDDNEGGVMHAHVVVNNTNLSTGNRFQNPDPRAMQASAQRLAAERGMRFFAEPEAGGPHPGEKGAEPAARTRQAVYVRRAEREIAVKGGYSWVADIRDRVTVAKRAAASPEEFRQMLRTMGVTVEDASRRNGRADWVYALSDAGTRRIRGENLGLAFGRKAVMGAMRGNPPLDAQGIASIAAGAIEVGDWSQLERLAASLETASRFGVRSLADFDRRIATMRRRGDDGSVSALEAARATAAETGMLPELAQTRGADRARDRDARGRAAAPGRRPDRQAAAQRQVSRQQEQSRSRRERDGR